MILTICRRLLLWRWNSSPAPNFGFYFQLEVLSEMRHQTSTCNVDLKLQLAIACEVLISKFNFKFEFKRSTSIFNLRSGRASALEGTEAPRPSFQVVVSHWIFKFNLKVKFEVEFSSWASKLSSAVNGGCSASWSRRPTWERRANHYPRKKQTDN